MAREPVMVRFSASGKAWLDRVASTTGVTRSEVVRTAVELAAAQEKALIERLGKKV